MTALPSNEQLDSIDRAYQQAEATLTAILQSLKTLNEAALHLLDRAQSVDAPAHVDEIIQYLNNNSIATINAYNEQLSLEAKALMGAITGTEEWQVREAGSQEQHHALVNRLEEGGKHAQELTERAREGHNAYLQHLSLKTLLTLEVERLRGLYHA